MGSCCCKKSKVVLRPISKPESAGATQTQNPELKEQDHRNIQNSTVIPNIIDADQSQDYSYMSIRQIYIRTTPPVSQRQIYQNLNETQKDSENKEIANETYQKSLFEEEISSIENSISVSSSIKYAPRNYILRRSQSFSSSTSSRLEAPRGESNDKNSNDELLTKLQSFKQRKKIPNLAVWEDGNISQYSELSTFTQTGRPALQQIINHNVVITNQVEKVKGDYKQINQYTILMKIQQQQIFKVYKVQNKQGQLFQMKVASRTMSNKPFINQELNVLEKASHPYIINLIEIIQNELKIYLIMEWAEKGSISYVAPLNESTVWKYFRQLIQVVEYIHSTIGIAHLNICPQSVLIDHNDNAKLCDFTQSRGLEGDGRISSAFLSKSIFLPELKAEVLIDLKQADIWQLGYCLYYCLQAKTLIKADLFSNQYIIPNKFTPQLQDLLQKLLQTNPNQRIRLENVKLHPWVTRNGYFPLI